MHTSTFDYGANLAGTVSEAVQLTTTETPDIFSLVVNIVPSNPVQAFANGDYYRNDAPLSF